MEDLYFTAMEYYKKQDYDNALIYIKKGIEENDVRCINAYGCFLYNGQGLEKDEEKGKQIIISNIEALEEESKIKRNRSKVNVYLAYKNQPFLKNEKKVFETLVRMYEADEDMNADRLFELATYYKKGEICEFNNKKAFDLYNESYEKYNDIYSLSELTSYYLYGFENIVERDINKALKLLKKGYRIEKSIFYKDLLTIYMGLDYTGIHEFTTSCFINYNYALNIITDLKNSNSVVSNEELHMYEITISYLIDHNKENALNKMNDLEINDVETFDTFWGHIIQFLNINNITFESYEFLNKLFFDKCFSIKNFKLNDICPYAKMAEVYNGALLDCEILHLNEKAINNMRKKRLYYFIEGEKCTDYLAMFSYAFMLLNDNKSIKDIDINKVFTLLNKSVSIYDKLSISLNYLAFCYEYGLGTNKDINKAINYYRKSYLLNDFHTNCSPIAAFNLYYLLTEEIKTMESTKEGNEILDNKKLLDLFSSTFLLESHFKDLDYSKKYFYYANLKKDYYKLGCCYLQGYFVNKNIDKGIEFLLKDTSEYMSYSLSLVGSIYYEGLDKEKDLNHAYSYFIKSIAAKDSYIDYNSYIYLFKLLTNKDFELFNPSKGLEYLSFAANNNNENIHAKADACYLLAIFYEDNEFNLIDRQKAKEYFQKAYDLGIDCSFAIESLERKDKLQEYYIEGIKQCKNKNLNDYELNKYAKQYAREKYISSSSNGIYNAIISLKLNNLTPNEKKIKIENLLKETFDYLWDDIKKEAKESMITALFIYSNFLELGFDIYSTLDFSPIINGLSKAFEIELKEFYFTKFLAYLKNNNISYKEFIDESTLIQLPFIESKIYVKDNKPILRYAYVEETENKKFTLGNVYFITTSGQNKYYLNRFRNNKNNGIKTKDSFGSSSKVNTRLVEYFNTVFKQEIFPVVNRENDIAKYLINFADDVNTIKFKRNSGSHDSIMTVEDAEFCADYLIMVKKLMYSFLSKIEHDKRK